MRITLARWWWGTAVASGLATVPVWPDSLLSDPARAGLDLGMAALVTGEADLGFEKDVGDPELVLEGMRTLLREPLTLFARGDAWWAAVSNVGTVPGLLAESLEVAPAPRREGNPPRIRPVSGLGILADARLREALAAYVAEVRTVRGWVNEAVRDRLTAEDQAFLVVSWMGGLVDLDDDPDGPARAGAEGIPPPVVDAWREAGRQLDGRPAAARWTRVVRQIDRDLLFQAGQALEHALDTLTAEARQVDTWPREPVTLATDLGRIRIGTLGADHHPLSCLVILDPGGDDHYAGSAGVANGLRGEPVAAILDFAGDDRYTSRRLAGPGTAWLGVAVLRDLAGNDVYRLDGSGLASALAGHASLTDAAGHDVYDAAVLAQACAAVGTAVLVDRAGNDLYRLGVFGQAASGVLGGAVLLDRDGNDTYLAGGTHPDHERNQERYLSLAQGFSIGDRPHTGGGIAILADLRGNDTYQADVYGQGVGYYYALGMLLDGEGHDTYTLHQYGQGAGIHLSGGLLADLAGHDQYTGFILAQGAAHDYAVGALVDRDGHDTYSADHHSQGRALNNAVAFLIDEAGDDGYFARDPAQCQGVGNNGGFRDYPSVAFLLDLAGMDRYSGPAQNDEVLVRPDIGVVVDTGTRLEVEP